MIDTGLKRVPRFDPAAGMTSLETVRVSQASAEQRKGRAGRLGPGRVIGFGQKPKRGHLQPMMNRKSVSADLSGLVLELARWGVHHS